MAVLDLTCKYPWFLRVGAAARGIKWEPDCSEVQSSGYSKHAKSMSARNMCTWSREGAGSRLVCRAFLVVLNTAEQT